MLTYIHKNKFAAALIGIFLIGGSVLAPITVELSQPIPQIQVQRAQATGFPVVDFLSSLGIGAGTATATVTTAKTVLQWVAQLLGKILKSIAKILLNKLTEATVNWINGGFKGSPQFVSNPDSFFKGIGDVQLKNLIDNIGYDLNKYPFGRAVSKVLIYNYQNKNADPWNRINFSLGQVIGPNWQKFQNDFSVGGWAGYNAMVQNPADNPYSTMFYYVDQANVVASKAQTAAQKELDLGQGFLNQKTCIAWREGPKAPATTGQGGAQAAQADFLAGHNAANCTQWTTTTPGTVVQSQISRALGSKFSQSELGAALGNSLSSIINALTTQLMSKGLKALTNAMGGSSAATEQAWSYDGQTLAISTNNSSDSNNPANWSTAADVSLNMNELFYTGQDIGITDENGNSIRLTLIEQAQLQADAYHNILNIMHGVGEPDANGNTHTQPSFAEAIKRLDDATPGPKYRWKQRLTEYLQNAVNKWTQAASSRVDKKAKQNAQDFADELTSDATLLPQEIALQVLTQNIPSYNDSQALVAQGAAFSIKQSEYVDNYTTALSTVARLKSIKNRLNDILANNTTTTQTVDPADVNLDQFLAQHPNAFQPADAAHIDNYPANWKQIISGETLQDNPFNYVTDGGQQSMKSVLKAYSLILDDLPNAATITEGQNAFAQVKSQYDNVGLMTSKVTNEARINSIKNIYKVTFGGPSHKFIQPQVNEPSMLKKVDAATLPANVLSDISTKGYSITQTYTNPGTVAAQIAAGLFGYPLLANPITPQEMYISPFGQTVVGELATRQLSGFDQVQLLTSRTRVQILADLQASPYSSDTLDTDHKATLNAFNDQQMTLVYSIAVSSTPIGDLGDGWDTNSTGTVRLTQAIDAVANYDSTDADDNAVTANETGEKLFYCQVLLDRYDKFGGPWDNTAISFFNRPKVKLTCDHFYGASASEYTNSAF